MGSFDDGTAAPDAAAITAGMYLMDNTPTRLVPYYIGQFGDTVAADSDACWKLQASGIEAANIDTARTTAVVTPDPADPSTTAWTAATRRQGPTFLASSATRPASTPASPRWWVARPSSTSAQLSSRTLLPRPTSRRT